MKLYFRADGELMTDARLPSPGSLTRFLARGSGGGVTGAGILCHRGRGRRGRCGWRRCPCSCRCRGGVQPAGMHPCIETLGGFRVDTVDLADDTTESGLEVGDGTAKE